MLTHNVSPAFLLSWYSKMRTAIGFKFALKNASYMYFNVLMFNWNHLATIDFKAYNIEPPPLDGPSNLPQLSIVALKVIQ